MVTQTWVGTISFAAVSSTLWKAAMVPAPGETVVRLLSNAHKHCKWQVCIGLKALQKQDVHTDELPMRQKAVGRAC